MLKLSLLVSGSTRYYLPSLLSILRYNRFPIFSFFLDLIPRLIR